MRRGHTRGHCTGRRGGPQSQSERGVVSDVPVPAAVRAAYRVDQRLLRHCPRCCAPVVWQGRGTQGSTVGGRASRMSARHDWPTSVACGSGRRSRLPQGRVHGHRPGDAIRHGSLAGGTRRRGQPPHPGPRREHSRARADRRRDGRRSSRPGPNHHSDTVLHSSEHVKRQPMNRSQAPRGAPPSCAVRATGSRSTRWP